ncbi:F-box domain, cyclin-like protein [Cynara cardunculus var. scolymus]|uniref:F-box domain, cyclin-like protein n=1 Tax=Cynara cardunculus var. scolymus TaxID=59895 RepID=A0A103XV46_CYNCS|nr:F-box domain, cyclin-like protein [Cynara cardunculus var. scolymus]
MDVNRELKIPKVSSEKSGIPLTGIWTAGSGDAHLKRMNERGEVEELKKREEGKKGRRHFIFQFFTNFKDQQRECSSVILVLNLSAFSKSSRMDVKDIKVYLPDTMNILPSNIIQTMLTLLPMRDAFRTSILSRNWRHHCVNIPKLQFDDEMFKGSNCNNLSVTCKLTHVIYPILLLHRGPILDFSLCISELSSCYQIDQIISYLSKKSTVKQFTLCFRVGDNHKLPSSFFMLQQLTCLKLQNCAFQPPSTFCGFSRLTSLYFHNVSITCKVICHKSFRLC